MRYSTQTSVCLPALLALLLVALLAAPVAADRDAHRAKAVLHEHTDTPLPVASVTIDRKSVSSVTTNVGDTYGVGSDTMIVNTDGHQVSIRKMLIPCEAEVTYSTENGMRKATRIDIKQVGNNPTWHWSAARPE